jgi:CheY-like chemotaxis protein
VLRARWETGACANRSNDVACNGYDKWRDEAVGFRKVLVVEDIGLIRMTTVDMLAELGLQVAEAGDGKSALELLDSDPQINLMIADLGLPGMSGRDLVAEVRRRRPDLKIVIASGDTDDKTRSEEVLAGVVFLAKPYDFEQLRRAVYSRADALVGGVGGASANSYCSSIAYLHPALTLGLRSTAARLRKMQTAIDKQHLAGDVA